MDGAAGKTGAAGTVELTAENFVAAVRKEGILFVDWWAAWCGPCRAFAPTYEKVAQAHPEIVFGKIDTEAQRELAGTYQIRSIPTLMIFRDSILLYAEAGMLPAAALEELIGKVKALDMDEVRRKVAEAEAAQPAA
jgi:thioredoxin 1